MSDATVLFYGLTLKERIDIVDGMVMLPFEQARAFMNENMVTDLASAGRRVPRLAVGRGGGQAVPMEARVPTDRLPRGAGAG